MKCHVLAPKSEKDILGSYYIHAIYYMHALSCRRKGCSINSNVTINCMEQTCYARFADELHIAKPNHYITLYSMCVCVIIKDYMVLELALFFMWRCMAKYMHGMLQCLSQRTDFLVGNSIVFPNASFFCQKFDF